MKICYFFGEFFGVQKLTITSLHNDSIRCENLIKQPANDDRYLANAIRNEYSGDKERGEGMVPPALPFPANSPNPINSVALAGLFSSSND